MEREGLGDLIYQQPTAQQCVLTTEQFSKRVLDSVAYNALELEHNEMDVALICLYSTTVA